MVLEDYIISEADDVQRVRGRIKGRERGGVESGGHKYITTESFLWSTVSKPGKASGTFALCLNLRSYSSQLILSIMYLAGTARLAATTVARSVNGPRGVTYITVLVSSSLWIAPPSPPSKFLPLSSNVAFFENLPACQRNTKGVNTTEYTPRDAIVMATRLRQHELKAKVVLHQLL